MDERKLDMIIRNLEMISSTGNRLSSIENLSGVYELDEDEYGDICFMRDLADECLRKIKEN